MAETHKKQHWVPKSYLAEWVDPSVPSGQEPYVWVFPKEGGAAKRRAPKNIFTETDLYTMRQADGSRDLLIEHSLASLESEFARVRREVLAPRALLNGQDRLILCAFVAASVARTTKHRDHWSSQWKGLLEDMDVLQQAAEKMSPPERERFLRAQSPAVTSSATLSYEDVAKLSAHHLPNTLRSSIAVQLPQLFGMDLSVLSTEDPVGFITSDAPCVWFDPDAYARPWLFRAPGLGWPSIEVTLPVSPRQLILLSRSGRRGYYRITDTILDELNRRTRGHANLSFVVNQDATKAIWYDMGSPPSREI